MRRTSSGEPRQAESDVSSTVIFMRHAQSNGAMGAKPMCRIWSRMKPLDRPRASYSRLLSPREMHRTDETGKQKPCLCRRQLFALPLRARVGGVAANEMRGEVLFRSRTETDPIRPD